MGAIDVYMYRYSPAKFFSDTDMVDDLQAKLRTITGGGSGNHTKIVDIKVQEVLGTCCVICIVQS